MEARSKSIRNILQSSDQYVIPFFQRSYSWGKKQWKRLCDDLHTLLLNEQHSQHFMGSLVCTPGKHLPGEVSPYHLIDGQQRLTTISLLLIAYRNVCKELKLIDLADEAFEDYLVHKRRTDFSRLKIVPRLGDRQSYIRLLDESTCDVSSSASLDEAVSFFYDWIISSASTQKQLRHLLNAISDRLSLVVITISGENPYEIFESLNSTGLPLQQSDLIRNHIFMQVPIYEQDNFSITKWEPYESLLREPIGKQSINATGFYRHYIMQSGRYCQKKNVYIDFKEHNKLSKFSPIEQVVELSIYAKYIRQIERLDSHPNNEIDRVLFDLAQLDISTAHCLILKILHLYDIQKIDFSTALGCLQDLSSFVIRRSICELSTRGYQQLFVRAVLVFQDCSRSSLQSFFAEQDWPSDKVLIDSLLKFSIYNRERQKCKLILSRLEESFEHKELVSTDNLSIEHIFPRNPSSDAVSEWSQLSQDKDDIKLLHTLGNLTLTGYNSELSNLPFSKKRVLLINSKLSLNRYFHDLVNWGPNDVRLRSKHLGEKLAELWPNPTQDYAISSLNVKVGATLKAKSKSSSDKLKRVGIIGVVFQMLCQATEDSPLYLEQVIEELAVRFPGRPVEGMRITADAQLRHQLRAYKGYDVRYCPRIALLILLGI